MARSGRPWATVITAVVCALVAAGALAVAAAQRDRGTPAASTEDTSPPTTSGVGVDGCAKEPCTVPATVHVSGYVVELVADAGNTSGRLRIGGAGASEVIEATITNTGAVLGPDSLQCLPGSIVACVLRGNTAQGMAGQVVVGRSGQWGELMPPFLSDAGYLGLDDVLPDPGAEIVVAQHRCNRTVVPDCSTTPVYVQVYDLRSEERGCTRNYNRLESLPGWPVVTLKSADVKPANCS